MRTRKKSKSSVGISPHATDFIHFCHDSVAKCLRCIMIFSDISEDMKV